MSARRLDCEQVLRHLLEYLDRELDADAMVDMAGHLAECRACFSRAEFEARLKQALRGAGTKRAPSRLRARMRSLLEKF